jgi:hypothetical protein
MVPLLFWLAGSVLAYILATNLDWMLRAKGRQFAPYGRWLKQAGRFLLFLGFPYLALGGWPQRPLQGLLSPEDLGLVGLSLGDSTGPGAAWLVTRWLEAAGAGLGVGILTLLVLAMAWAGANRGPFPQRLQFPHRPWWALAVDVLYLQLHWAFYRSALAVVLGDLYAGVFAGLGLVYLEWSFNPFWRRDWQLASRAGGRWLRAALALVAALIFLLTRNLWVCLVVHLPLELLFWRLGRDQSPDLEDRLSDPALSSLPEEPASQGHQPAAQEP